MSRYITFHMQIQLDVLNKYHWFFIFYVGGGVDGGAGAYAGNAGDSNNRFLFRTPAITVLMVAMEHHLVLVLASLVMVS